MAQIQAQAQAQIQAAVAQIRSQARIQAQAVLAQAEIESSRIVSEAMVLSAALISRALFGGYCVLAGRDAVSASLQFLSRSCSSLLPWVKPAVLGAVVQALGSVLCGIVLAASWVFG